MRWGLISAKFAKTEYKTKKCTQGKKNTKRTFEAETKNRILPIVLRRTSSPRPCSGEPKVSGILKSREKFGNSETFSLFFEPPPKQNFKTKFSGAAEIFLRRVFCFVRVRCWWCCAFESWGFDGDQAFHSFRGMPSKSVQRRQLGIWSSSGDRN